MELHRFEEDRQVHSWHSMIISRYSSGCVTFQQIKCRPTVGRLITVAILEKSSDWWECETPRKDVHCRHHHPQSTNTPNLKPWVYHLGAGFSQQCRCYISRISYFDVSLCTFEGISFTGVKRGLEGKNSNMGHLIPIFDTLVYRIDNL